MKMKNCKVCGNAVAISAKNCPQCGAQLKKPLYKRAGFWGLVAIIAVVALSNGGKKDNGTAVATNESAKTETVIDNDIDGKICEIVSAATGQKNYEGKPTVIITYQYTNNADEAAAFDITFETAVFQNGIECSSDYIYDEDDGMKEIRPGTTITLTKSYVLNDTTSDIEVEVSGFISFDNTVITKTFTIND